MADDWDIDDWELDDWEEDAFDDDVWDSSQLDLEDDLTELDDELGPETGAEGLAAAPPAGGPGLPGGAPIQTKGTGGGMTWSAWEVGTAFALGGWLADRHAEEVGRQVRDALSAAREHPGRRLAEGGTDDRPRGAPQPPPPSGYPYATATGTLRVGEPMDQGALFIDLAAAGGERRDWLVQAEGRGAGGGPLVLVVSAVPDSAGPRLWVVAEEHPGGFSAVRLVPVFQREQQGGVALFATDHPAEAADAVAWACAREGVEPDALSVTERRP